MIYFKYKERRYVLIIDISAQINRENNLYQYFTNKELDETAKELTYIEKYSIEYKSYNNFLELKED